MKKQSPDVSDVSDVSIAEEWQRAEASATWERFKAGDRREVSMAQIDADFDAAIAREKARRSA